ncbi:MAG: ribbon-helix-helix protein, CopG family [Gemmatimonadota bacterium]
MVRKQIRLTERQNAALEAMSRRTGRSQSELIRDAIDAMIAPPAFEDRLALMAVGRGMWAGTAELPYFGSVRREFDRASD